MADYSYTGLGVVAHRDEAQGVWKFGVLLDGAFVTFAVRKLGGVDDQIGQAKAAAAAAPPDATPAAG